MTLPVFLFLVLSIVPASLSVLTTPPLAVAHEDWTAYTPSANLRLTLPIRLISNAYPGMPIAERMWNTTETFDEALVAELKISEPSSLFVHLMDRATVTMRDSGKLRDMSAIFEKYALGDAMPAAVMPSVIGRDGKIALLPFVSEPYAYTCDRKKMEALGFPKAPRTSSELIEMFRRAKGAGFVPVVIPIGGVISFASNMFISMNGKNATERLGEGQLSFLSHEVSRWAKMLDFFHRERYVVIGPKPADLTRFLTGTTVCTWTVATMRTTIGISDDVVMVFISPPWNGPGFEGNDLSRRSGIDYQLNMGVIDNARYADIGMEAVELVIRYFREHARNGSQEYKGRNLFIPTKDRASDGSDDLMINELTEVVPDLTVVFIPEFTEVLQEKITPFLFRTIDPDDVTASPVDYDVIAAIESLEPLRLEMILSKTLPPVVSVRAGIYSEPFPVTIESRTNGSKVLFTTDGDSDMIVRGLAYYSEPIFITEGTTILRAVATAPGYEISDEITVTYTVKIPQEGNSGRSTMVIALAIAIVVVVIAAAVTTSCVLRRRQRVPPVPKIDASEIDFDHIVGIGSRGVIYKGRWRGSAVAIKLYMSRSEIQRALADIQDTGAFDVNHSSGLMTGTFDGAVINGVTPSPLATGSVEISTQESVANPITRAPNYYSNNSKGRNSNNLLLLGRNPDGIIRSLGMGVTGLTASTLSSAFPSEGDGRYQYSDPISKVSSSTRGGSPSATDIKRAWADIRRELDTIAALRSPNLVTVYGTVKIRGTPGVVLEWMGNGSLYDAIHNPAVVLGPRKKLEISLDLARGIRHLHSQQPPVLHRDIKSLNCLLTSSLEAKLADFDLAVVCDGSTNSKRNSMNNNNNNNNSNDSKSSSSSVNDNGSNGKKKKLMELPFHRASASRRTIGTIAWAAPEVFKTGGMIHTPASDVFAFGVVLWEIFTEQEPFANTTINTMDQVANFVTRGGRLDTSSELIPTAIADIIHSCWREKSTDRPCMDTIAERLTVLCDQQEPNTQTRRDVKDTAHALECAHLIMGESVISALARSSITGTHLEPPTIRAAGVVITDVVGFSAIARKIGSSKSAELLRRLFSGFDAIVRKRQGVKYKIVGDAFITIVPPFLAAERTVSLSHRSGATGSSEATRNTGPPAVNNSGTISNDNGSTTATKLPDEGKRGKAKKGKDNLCRSSSSAISEIATPALFASNPQGFAQRTAMIALELEALSRTILIDNAKPAEGSLQIRAGLHIGPLTAHMMDLDTVEFFGDTMNFAARLESSSEPGRVHTSEFVWQLLRDCPDFSIISRGHVQLKGRKEPTSTFYIEVAAENQHTGKDPKETRVVLEDV